MKKLFVLAAISPLFLVADNMPDPMFAATNTQPTKKRFKKVSYSGKEINKDPNAAFAQKYFSEIDFGGSYTFTSLKVKGKPNYHGSLGGAQAIYEYKAFDDLYLALAPTYKQGTLNNRHGKRELLYIDVHQRIGYTIASCTHRWVGTFYTGVGYRHYGQNLRQSGNSITYDYNEFYVPVGLKSSYSFKTWLEGAFNFMWMPQVNSTVKVDALKGARWSLEKKLSNFKVELPLTFFLTQDHRYNISFKPFFEHWKDGQSTAKVVQDITLDLNQNTYNFWGAELNFGFAF